MTYQWISSAVIATQNRTASFFTGAHIHADRIRRATSTGAARILKWTALRVVMRVAGKVGNFKVHIGAVEARVGGLKLGRREDRREKGKEREAITRHVCYGSLGSDELGRKSKGGGRYAVQRESSFGRPFWLGKTGNIRSTYTGAEPEAFSRSMNAGTGAFIWSKLSLEVYPVKPFGSVWGPCG